MGRSLNSGHKSVKAHYLMCWLDKKARNYVTSNDTDLKDIQKCWIHLRHGKSPNVMEQQPSHSLAPLKKPLSVYQNL